MSADTDKTLQTLAADRFGSLSEAERRLLAALLTGLDANCGPEGLLWGAPANDPARADAWGHDRTIRAVLLAWLCTDATATGQIHRLGIRVTGARIDDVFDLSFANVPFPLSFSACSWPRGMRLRGAAIPELRLTRCRIGPLPPDGQGRDVAIMAGGLRVPNAISMSDFHAEGEVRLFGADIGGLECSGGSTFKNANGPALNAEGAKIDGPVLLRDHFHAEGEVRLFGADIGGLECSGGSTFKNANGPALNAEGAKIDGPVLLRDHFHAEGEVCLMGADIGGLERSGGSTFKNANGPALNAERAKIDGPILLRNHFHAEGEVRLMGTDIGGILECRGSTFKNANGPALNAVGAKIDADVFLRNDFHAEGEVCLMSADIGGMLECSGGSTFKNANGPALTAEGAKIDGSVLLRDHFHAEGEVRLMGADIGGTLECRGSTLKNANGPALNALRAKVGAHVLLHNDFHAEGEVCLPDADIGGVLECTGGSTFKNANGWALNALRAKVGADVFLRNDFHAEGEVCLMSAYIGGGLWCTEGSTFKNASGRALDAVRVKIGSPVLLGKDFYAEGEVRLLDAEIGGLECSGRFKNTSGRALDAERVKIGTDVFLHNDFHADGEIRLVGATVRGRVVIENERPTGTNHTSTFDLTLSGARIEGALDIQGLRCANGSQVSLQDTSCNVLIDAEEGWPSAGNLILDGFVYHRLRSALTPAIRLDWLRRALPSDKTKRWGQFRPHSYRQLAGVLRAQGFDAEAKAVLIGMAQDRRRWANLGRLSRFWQLVLWITIRNGHQPLRAGSWLLVLWLVGFLAFGLGCQMQVMVPSERFAYDDFVKGVLPGYYPRFCALVYSIDTSLPIIGFGQKDRWYPRLVEMPPPPGSNDGVGGLLCKAGITRRLDPNSMWVSRATLAASLEVYRWLHLAFGWFLATMLLAGISGLVGRE